MTPKTKWLSCSFLNEGLLFYWCVRLRSNSSSLAVLFGGDSCSEERLSTSSTQDETCGIVYREEGEGEVCKAVVPTHSKRVYNHETGKIKFTHREGKSQKLRNQPIERER